MNKEQLLSMSYHVVEARRHRDEADRLKRIHWDSEDITIPEGSTMVERYFALVARVEPFLTIPFSEHRNKDKMLRTPVLPIHGIVESKPVIFSLRLEHNVSRQELYAYAVYSLLTKKMTSLPIVKK